MSHWIEASCGRACWSTYSRWRATRTRGVQTEESCMRSVTQISTKTMMPRGSSPPVSPFSLRKLQAHATEYPLEILHIYTNTAVLTSQRAGDVVGSGRCWHPTASGQLEYATSEQIYYLRGKRSYRKVRRNREQPEMNFLWPGVGLTLRASFGRRWCR